MLLEAETNKYCPGGNDIGAISNLITWVLNFFLSKLMRVCRISLLHQVYYTVHCKKVKKGYRFSRPQPGCQSLLPARESLVSDIPAGEVENR
jgi:hypothetical protein